MMDHSARAEPSQHDFSHSDCYRIIVSATPPTSANAFKFDPVKITLLFVIAFYEFVPTVISFALWLSEPSSFL
jgi:hypothetical protein